MKIDRFRINDSIKIVMLSLFLFPFIDISAQSDNIEEQCDSLFGESYYYFSEKEDYQKAKELGLKVLERWNSFRLPHNRSYANYVNFLSLYYASLKDYQTAISTALSVQDVMDKINHEDPDYLAYLGCMSLWYAEIPNYPKSEKWAKLALETMDELSIPDSMDYAELLNILATSERFNGKYGDAIEHFRKAFLIINRINPSEYLTISKSLYGLSTCYGIIGRYEDAIKYGEISLKIRSNSSNYYLLANQLLELSSYYGNLLNYSKAIEYGEKAIEICKSGKGEGLDYARALHSVALVYYKLKKDSIGDVYSEKAYKIRMNLLGENDSELASSLIDIANILSKNGEYHKSIMRYRHALSIYKKTEGELSNGYRTSLEYLILSLALTQSFDEIKPLLKECIGLLQKSAILNFNNFSSVSRNYYWNDLVSSFERLFFVSTCIQYENDPDMAKTAYDIALLSKGILLFSQVGIERIIRESQNSELNMLFSRLKTLKDSISDNNNDNINHEVERLESEIVTRATKVKGFKWPLEYNWENVQSSLKEREVALEYYKAYRYYYAILIRKGWKSPKVIELFNNNIIDSLPTKGTQLYEKTNSQYAYNLLFRKISKYIKAGDTVYYSPSGALFQINLECLQDLDGNFLSDKYTLSRLSSTRLLVNNKIDKNRQNAVLYGGLTYDVDLQEMQFQSSKYNKGNHLDIFNVNEKDSLYRSGWKELPGTKIEINNIKALFESKNIPCSVFSGIMGNEESFKALSGNSPQIIHLSTHGFFMKNKRLTSNNLFSKNESINNNSLMSSGLILSAAHKAWTGDAIPKGIDDGILFAEEISFLNLEKTDVVVLSACQTALGSINHEGVWGLQRAFKLAGVNSIIMSLWKVDDISTRLLMTDFYRNYLSGISKYESLKKAQQYVREFKNEAGEKLFKDPSYWAAWILLDGLN